MSLLDVLTNWRLLQEVVCVVSNAPVNAWSYFSVVFHERYKVSFPAICFTKSKPEQDKLQSFKQ